MKLRISNSGIFAPLRIYFFFKPAFLFLSGKLKYIRITYEKIRIYKFWYFVFFFFKHFFGILILKTFEIILG